MGKMWKLDFKKLNVPNSEAMSLTQSTLYEALILKDRIYEFSKNQAASVVHSVWLLR